MARPDTIDDLADHQTAAVTILSIRDIDAIIAAPDALRDLGDLIESCRAAGFTVSAGTFGGFDVTRPPNDAELAAALRNAQSSWDTGHADYQRTVDEPGWYPDYPYAMHKYCDTEGLDKPTEPTTEN